MNINEIEVTITYELPLSIDINSDLEVEKNRGNLGGESMERALPNNNGNERVRLIFGQVLATLQSHRNNFRLLQNDH